MKIIVIGSKGFIGSNLTKYLEDKGEEVWEADVIVDYRKERYFLIDVTNSNFHSVFEAQDFDLCINCSGAASVPDSLKNPLRDYQLNTANVFNMLDAIRIYRPHCQFINLSSAAVYGNPVSLPVEENAMVNPVSPYGYHKAMSEKICEEFHRFFGLKTCSLRIFSAFGEGLYKQLFWDLFRKAQAADTISLFGTGNESRDFIYIKDLVEAIFLVSKNANFTGETLNIANGKEIFIKDAVSIFYNCFNQNIEYTFSGTGRKGDPSNWVADITTLKSWGYQPKYTLSEGLQNFYQWAKTNA